MCNLAYNLYPGLAGVDGPSVYPEYLTDYQIARCPSDSNGNTVLSPDLPEFETAAAEIAAGLTNGTVLPACMQLHVSMPRSYFYMGFATETPAQGLAAAQGWFNQAIVNISWLANVRALGLDCPYGTTVNFLTRDSDLDIDSLVGAGATEADGSPVPATLYRLREGIERFVISDINNPAASAKAQSEMPILWDAWGNTQNMYGATPADSSAGVVIFNHVPGGSNVLYMDGHVRFLKLKEEYPCADDPEGTYGEDFSGFCAAGAGYG
ncbi:MAG: hypothetical protein K1Y02_07155 [Candidatus Hydrogenedentes bacterium]|nr:hypothetical protein [Candidatus Hydrogenedentota bacterium]